MGGIWISLRKKASGVESRGVEVSGERGFSSGKRKAKR